MSLDDFIDDEEDSLPENTIRELNRDEPPNKADSWVVFEPESPNWLGEITGDKGNEDRLTIYMYDTSDTELESCQTDLSSDTFVDLKEKV